MEISLELVEDSLGKTMVNEFEVAATLELSIVTLGVGDNGSSVGVAVRVSKSPLENAAMSEIVGIAG